MPQVVFNVIKPGPFHSEVFRQRMVQAVQRTVDAAEKDFAETYKTFKRAPKFVKEIKISANYISGSVTTDDENYVRLNNGTKGPYLIPKAGKGLLVFKAGYNAKTVPKTLIGRGGGAFGDTVFMFGQVTHPGIEPRHWDIVVKDKETPWFLHYTRQALKEAARASGHGIK